MNTLPIYKSTETIESLLPYNKGRLLAYYCKDDDYIPAFHDIKREIGIGSISINSFELKKVKIENNRATETHEKTYSLNTSVLDVYIYDETYYKVALIAPLLVSQQVDPGIYQIFITMSNGLILKSGLFDMKGVKKAQYQCSNASYDGVSIFTIDITRLDSDPEAISEGVFILKFYNQQTAETILISSVLVDLGIGGSTTLQFNINIPINFGYLKWMGICTGLYRTVSLDRTDITWDSTAYTFDQT